MMDEQVRALVFDDAALVERAVMAARPYHRSAQRWVAIKETFACGSTVAVGLCRRFNLDPDELVKP